VFKEFKEFKEGLSLNSLTSLISLHFPKRLRMRSPRRFAPRDDIRVYRGYRADQRPIPKNLNHF
jgi:hypothetical protein